MGNGLAAALGVVALRLYTELAPPDVYGMASLILGSLTLASQCVIQPIAATQIRYHTQAVSENRAESFTAEALTLVLAGTSILALAATAVLMLFLAGKISYALGTAIAGGLWLVLTGVRSVLMSRLHAEQRMRRYMALRVFESAVTIAATTILLLAASAHPAALVVGQCIGILAVVVCFASSAPWSALGLSPSRWPHAGLRAKIMQYGAPFIPLTLLYWLSSLADRYVLAALVGAGAAGKYFAAFIVASAGFGITNGIISDLFRPKLFAAENTHDRTRASRIFQAWIGSYIAISLCILLGIATLGDWLIWLVISPAYRDGALLLLLWISVGFAINGLNTALENRLLSYGHSHRLILPVAVGAIANVAMSFLLIPPNGTLGAAQASCLSFTAQLVCMFLVLRRAAFQRKGVLEANSV